MNLLVELLRDYQRIDPPQDDLAQEVDVDQSIDDADPNDSAFDDFAEDQPEDVDPETDVALDDVANRAVEDPDRQGLIRTVDNAHLVYKRETEDGTFEELWVYNSTDMRAETETKRAILSGTDIPVNKTRSPDGAQTYELWASGNVEMMVIRGLPS